jgi:hypothetical protein
LRSASAICRWRLQGINKLDTFDTILLRYTPIPSLVSLSVYASMSVQRMYTALSRAD